MWEGREWQDYCVRLLRLHHGATEVQEMPSRHDGDRGIEAFTLDGCAFQCYAADDSKPSKQLYEDQRDKLTEDLGKLITYQDSLAKIFGPMKIRRYMFMVPRHDSTKLVEHASVKSREVLGWGLKFIANDFKIQVVTDAAYSEARTRIAQIPKQVLETEAARPDQLALWREGHSELLSNADRKLADLGLGRGKRSAFTTQLLQQFLNSENALEQLRSIAPETWNSVLRAKRRKEETLELEHAPSQSPEPRDINAIRLATQAEYEAAAPQVSGESCTTIAWGSVADWIFRCPLEFGDGDEERLLD